jgi:hypothetical protein
LSIFDFLNGSSFYLAKVDISEWVQKNGYVRVERVVRELRFLSWTKIWPKTSQINPRDLRKMSIPASFSGQLNHRRLTIAAVGGARASFHDIPPPPIS